MQIMLEFFTVPSFFVVCDLREASVQCKCGWSQCQILTKLFQLVI